MISVEEALQIIDNAIVLSKPKIMAVHSSLGCVLANDVLSPIYMPPFAQSAMDGYAVRFNGAACFSLKGEIKAGDNAQPLLKEGEAVRIFTGAPVPATADAVVRQEDTEVVDGVLVVNPLPRAKANVRPLGEQIAEGAIALQKGQVLNAASIGYMATLGITEIEVYEKPKVTILVTGNELVEPGTPLQYGQIYESNAPMLVSALNDYGITNVEVQRVKDDYTSTLEQLKLILADNDLVLCSGGISVGDYDFVGKALKELGTQELFYKVKQKPGKPLFFGIRNKTIVFALPGNPAAALTCFYVYVLKALNLMTGKRPEGLRRV
ncbi:MAG: molybdopterin molybdotransferase MoeA, partial [Schleiferiaceae bacterium]|nr:molybdopterin molybdotransferase MoeA [Schleiferiaceae bacterium]